MVKRFYGGLTASTALISSTSSASGLFNFSDQMQGEYTDTWPVPKVPELQYLVVGGGGGGGKRLAGGGGAGAAKIGNLVLSDAPIIKVVVASGGPGSTNQAVNGINGGISTISTSQPDTYSASLVFNGSADLSIPNGLGATLNIGNTFTIEFWFYRTSGSTEATIIQKGEADWRVSISSAGVNFYVTNGTSASISQPINNNTWYHVAITEDGTTLRCFLNGVLRTSSALTGFPATTTKAVSIGANTATIGKTWYYTGYITNLRVVKGTAVYTSSFTVPTSPVPNISGTTLLITPNLTTTTPVDATGLNTITNTGPVTVSIINPWEILTNIANCIGGGGGGSAFLAGSDGGSGGGAGTGAGGLGTDGFNGGSANQGRAGGGGGGAGGPGTDVSTISPGNGGIGILSSITGTGTYYAGGGGGGGNANDQFPRGIGGLGGGGNGNFGSVGGNGSAGSANTGGGGGGGGAGTDFYSETAYNGGSGIVILSYPTTYPPATSATGTPSYSVVNGYRIYSFSTSGSLGF